MEWKDCAYAKINLTLDILGKLPNGYHSLSMVMQSVSLHDDVILRIDSEKPGIRVDCGGGAPSGPENIVWKAARAFLTAAALQTMACRLRLSSGLLPRQEWEAAAAMQPLPFGC